MKTTEKQREATRQWRLRNPTYAAEYKRRPEVRLLDAVRQRGYHARRPWQGLLSNAKQRAKVKDIKYTLTDEWARSNYTGRCALTDIEFVVQFEGKHGGRPYSPSIDRIDQSRGYTPDNCRFILHALNCFRGVMSDEEMLRIAETLVATHHNRHCHTAAA